MVDAGGRDSAGLHTALLLANVAIIPVGASNLDATAMADLLEAVELAREYNPDLDVRVRPPRVGPCTKDAGVKLEFLTEQKLNVLAARVCERVTFRRAIGEGAIVHEVGKGKAAQAIAEMGAFLKEVVGA